MATAVPASRRIDGLTGELWSDTFGGGAADAGGYKFMADVTSITGTIAQDRREVPIPGTRNTQYKGGRVTRSGSFSFQMIDDQLLKFFLDNQVRDLDVQRGPSGMGDFSFALLIVLDDPESWGASRLLLSGCRFWEMPVGFNINDLVEREIPFTWEGETLQTPLVRGV